MVVNKLSVKEIVATKPPVTGEYLLGDGGGLHMRIRPRGKSWLFKYTDLTGKKKKLGLGTYPEVSLGQAREIAGGMRRSKHAGRAPQEGKIEERIAARKRSLDTLRRMRASGIDTQRSFATGLKGMLTSCYAC